MVTSDPVGLFLKSSSNAGMSGTASGNSSSKKRRTSSSVLVDIPPRRDAGDSSQKSVQVNEPSGFGSAIIIKLLRGQMWSASFSIRHEPSAAGGMVSSL